MTEERQMLAEKHGAVAVQYGEQVAESVGEENALRYGFIGLIALITLISGCLSIFVNCLRLWNPQMQADPDPQAALREMYERNPSLTRRRYANRVRHEAREDGVHLTRDAALDIAQHGIDVALARQNKIAFTMAMRGTAYSVPEEIEDNEQE